MTLDTAPPATTIGPAPVSPTVEPPEPKRFSVGRALAWAFMIVVITVSLFPFYWMLRTALSSNSAIYAGSGSILPVQFSWGGFARVFGLQTGQDAVDAGGSGQSVAFWHYLLNSIVIATLVTVGQVSFSTMAAYAFARLEWRWRGPVFAFFLAGLMIPAIFTFLPNFVIIKQLGLVDSLLGIALPTMLMTPFAVFFLRQFFLGISREVEEAALVEGASKVRVFFRLILPMSSAPIATLAILTYITSWNDYFWPLMVSYTDRSRVLTVALGVFKSQTPQTGPDWSGLMAATLVAALPMLVLFCFFAKRIVNSIGFSGIK